MSKKEQGMTDTFADDRGFSGSLGGNAGIVLPVAYKSTQHAQKESNCDILPMMPVILQYRHHMCKLVGVVHQVVQLHELGVAVTTTVKPDVVKRDHVCFILGILIWHDLVQFGVI